MNPVQKQENQKVVSLYENYSNPKNNNLDFLNDLDVRNYLKNCNVPKIFQDLSTNDFKITNNNIDAVSIAINSIDSDAGLYIWGKCGTGKTMLSSIICTEKIKKYVMKGNFISATKMYQLVSPYNNSEHETNKTNFERWKLLVIDDLGAEKLTDWNKQILFEILNERYNNKRQTIITSNFSIGKLEERIGGYEGERIVRRIKALCDEIELKYYN